MRDLRRIYSISWIGLAIRLAADTVLLQIALIAGLAARYYFAVAFENTDGSVDMNRVVDLSIGFYRRTAIPLTVLALLIFFVNGFYTRGRFYQGRYKLLVVTQAVTLAYLAYGFLAWFLSGNLHFSRGGLLAAWLVSVILLAGARVWNQVWASLTNSERELSPRVRPSAGQRILVIGGAGYIGSALLPKLVKQNFDVRILDLMLFGDSALGVWKNDPRVEVIRGDFRHVDKVAQAMRGVIGVVHLGGIVGDPACSLDENLTIDVNLSATREIGELAKASGVERLVFASTCSVYGACDEMIDERSIVRPLSLYGHTKLASERILREMADDRFFSTILRFATIYGLSGRTRLDLVVNLLAARAKIDGEITICGGGQWRPFLHVEDAADAIALVLTAPRSLVANQVFNVGSSDENYTIAAIGEMVRQQVVGARVIVDETQVDTRNYRVDFRKIRHTLGFEPVWSVEDGIHQVLEAIAAGEITDYQDPQYSNVKHLSEAGTDHLARDNWARELIKDVSGG